MRTADPHEIHPKNFQYPVATQPHEFLQFENKPHGARIEELSYRWVENENFPPAIASDAKNAVSRVPATYAVTFIFDGWRTRTLRKVLDTS